MRVLSEILDSTPIGYYLTFHIVYRIDKVSVYGKISDLWRMSNLCFEVKFLDIFQSFTE